MAKKVVLITGASGNVGKASIAALGALSETLEVRAGVRNPAKPESAALASIASNVTVVTADPISAEFKNSLEGVDYLYVVTPGSSNRTEVAVAAITAGKAAGVKFILLISVLTTTLTNTIFGKQFEPIEKTLKESGISYAILRLPFFVENNFGQAGSIKEQGAIYTSISADKPLTAVTTKDIGDVVAKILSNPEPHHGQTYRLSSPLYTGTQLAKAFSDALGKPVNYVQVPYEATKQALLGFGFEEWQVDGINELNALVEAGDPVYVDTDATTTIPKILGRPATTIEEWVNSVAGAFK